MKKILAALVAVSCLLIPSLPIVHAQEEVDLSSPISRTRPAPPDVTKTRLVKIMTQPAPGIALRAVFAAGYIDGDGEWRRVKGFSIEWTNAEWQAKLTLQQRNIIRGWVEMLKAEGEALTPTEVPAVLEGRGQ